jgi:hypothetical protein
MAAPGGPRLPETPPPPRPPAAQAEAYTFWRTIAPLLDAASPNASRAINAWTLPSERRAAPRLGAGAGATGEPCTPRFRRAALASTRPARWNAPLTAAPPCPLPAVNLDFVDDVDLRTAKAFTTAYKGLGITAKDIGRYGTKQPELKCKAYVPNTDGGILTTTQAKDGLRPTAGGSGGAAAPAPAAPAPAAGAGGGSRRHRLFRLFA